MQLAHDFRVLDAFPRLKIARADYRKGLANGEPDGTWRVFVPPLFDAAVQRPGDLRWEILGGLFGQERIGRTVT